MATSFLPVLEMSRTVSNPSQQNMKYNDKVDLM